MAKYVIDIDEEDYEVIKEVDELGGKWKTDIASQTMKAIANATPFEEVLEDIKAEIEKEGLSDTNNSKFIFVRRVFEIIDNHISGKE